MNIKEMAIAYGKVNYIVRYTADGDKEIDENTGAEFFEDGANAVLEKIEGHLNRIDVDNHSDDDLEDLYDTLCEMVKNLKEE